MSDKFKSLDEVKEEEDFYNRLESKPKRAKGMRELFKDEDFRKTYHSPLTVESFKKALGNDKEIKNNKSNKSNKR